MTTVETSQGNFTGDAILLATGRVPNTDLALNNTDIELGTHGEIKVNNHLQTSVSHIYAAGDVKGGLQFTYISLDDFRILKSELFGDRSRHTEIVVLSLIQYLSIHFLVLVSPLQKHNN